MRLPIWPMQALLVRPSDAEDESWLRSTIVDFTPDAEITIHIPLPEKQAKRRAEDEARARAEAEAAEASADTGGEDQPTEVSAEVVAGEAVHIESVVGEEAEEEEDVDQVEYHSGMDVDVQLSFPDGLRFFTTKVRSIDHISYGGSLRLAWPVEGTRVQRQEHVRIRAVKGAEVLYREEESRKLKRLKGFTTDISAGGVRVRVPEALPDETQVELELDIPVPGARTLHGRVVRSGIIGKVKKPEAYWLGIEFVGVGQVLRRALTQYVFDLEREQIRTALE